MTENFTDMEYPINDDLPDMYNLATRQTWEDNNNLLKSKGIRKNGIKSDIVRDFWLMAEQSGYDDITDHLVGLHIARCLNRMAKTHGYISKTEHEAELEKARLQERDLVIQMCIDACGCCMSEEHVEFCDDCSFRKTLNGEFEKRAKEVGHLNTKRKNNDN